MEQGSRWGGGCAEGQEGGGPQHTLLYCDPEGLAGVRAVVRMAPGLGCESVQGLSRAPALYCSNCVVEIRRLVVPG